MTNPPIPPAGEQRRLAAIVFTDVVGYSARMQRDEAGTMRLVAADFSRMRERCQQHGGEVLNSMGDGLLLCFGSAVSAVACALQLQEEFAARRQTQPPAQALEHRMGVHIGDVFRTETGGVAGDGVNIAARLEPKAPSGGLCVSQMVYDTVKGKVPMQAVFVGPETFKNLAEPISIWHLAPEHGPALATPAKSRPPAPATRPRRLVAPMAAVLLVAVGSGWLWLGGGDGTTATDPASIAVLPFTNVGADKESEYFSDGISEELLNVLARVPGLRVAARTSAFSFKGTNFPRGVPAESKLCGRPRLASRRARPRPSGRCNMPS